MIEWLMRLLGLAPRCGMCGERREIVASVQTSYRRASTGEQLGEAAEVDVCEPCLRELMAEVAPAANEITVEYED